MDAKYFDIHYAWSMLSVLTLQIHFFLPFKRALINKGASVCVCMGSTVYTVT